MRMHSRSRKLGKRSAIAGALGVIGSLLVSGTAAAAVTGFTYAATISPQKQSAKTFGPAAISSTLDTTYTGGFTPTPTTTVDHSEGHQVHGRTLP